jgi:hypothetical protein
MLQTHVCVAQARDGGTSWADPLTGTVSKQLTPACFRTNARSAELVTGH